MKKALYALTAALFVTAAGVANAQTTPPTSPSAAQTATPAPTTETMTAPADTKMKAELKDGTKVEVTGDNFVYIVNADGTKTTAPDGTHTLKNGTNLVVKDGKKIEG